MLKNVGKLENLNNSKNIIYKFFFILKKLESPKLSLESTKFFDGNKLSSNKLSKLKSNKFVSSSIKKNEISKNLIKTLIPEIDTIDKELKLTDFNLNQENIPSLKTDVSNIIKTKENIINILSDNMSNASFLKFDNNSKHILETDLSEINYLITENNETIRENNKNKNKFIEEDNFINNLRDAINFSNTVRNIKNLHNYNKEIKKNLFENSHFNNTINNTSINSKKEINNLNREQKSGNKKKENKYLQKETSPIAKYIKNYLEKLEKKNICNNTIYKNDNKNLEENMENYYLKTDRNIEENQTRRDCRKNLIYYSNIIQNLNEEAGKKECNEKENKSQSPKFGKEIKTIKLNKNYLENIEINEDIEINHNLLNVSKMDKKFDKDFILQNPIQTSRNKTNSINFNIENYSNSRNPKKVEEILKKTLDKNKIFLNHKNNNNLVENTGRINKNNLFNRSKTPKEIVTFEKEILKISNDTNYIKNNNLLSVNVDNSNIKEKEKKINILNSKNNLNLEILTKDIPVEIMKENPLNENTESNIYTLTKQNGIKSKEDDKFNETNYSELNNFNLQENKKNIISDSDSIKDLKNIEIDEEKKINYIKIYENKESNYNNSEESDNQQNPSKSNKNVVHRKNFSFNASFLGKIDKNSNKNNNLHKPKNNSIYNNAETNYFKIGNTENIVANEITKDSNEIDTKINLKKKSNKPFLEIKTDILDSEFIKNNFFSKTTKNKILQDKFQVRPIELNSSKGQNKMKIEMIQKIINYSEVNVESKKSKLENHKKSRSRDFSTNDFSNKMNGHYLKENIQKGKDNRNKEILNKSSELLVKKENSSYNKNENNFDLNNLSIIKENDSKPLSKNKVMKNKNKILSFDSNNLNTGNFLISNKTKNDLEISKKNYIDQQGKKKSLTNPIEISDEKTKSKNELNKNLLMNKKIHSKSVLDGNKKIELKEEIKNDCVKSKPLSKKIENNSEIENIKQRKNDRLQFQDEGIELNKLKEYHTDDELVNIDRQKLDKRNIGEKETIKNLNEEKEYNKQKIEKNFKKIDKQKFTETKLIIKKDKSLKLENKEKSSNKIKKNIKDSKLLKLNQESTISESQKQKNNKLELNDIEEVSETNIIKSNYEFLIKNINIEDNLFLNKINLTKDQKDSNFNENDTEIETQNKSTENKKNSKNFIVENLIIDKVFNIGKNKIEDLKLSKKNDDSEKYLKIINKYKSEKKFNNKLEEILCLIFNSK